MRKSEFLHYCHVPLTFGKQCCSIMYEEGVGKQRTITSVYQVHQPLKSLHKQKASFNVKLFENFKMRRHIHLTVGIKIFLPRIRMSLN